MKKVLIALSLIIPIILLVLFWLSPESDPMWHQPLLHFYLVTFFTFAAVVVAVFTAVSLGENSQPRHQLLATAFAAMGALFFVHGAVTPQAIVFTSNPGTRWAAWLTLFVGGLIFALAALDTPQRPLRLRLRRVITPVLVLFCGGFYLIVAFAPGWLSLIDAQASPWHEQVVTLITFAFWLFAAVRLTLTWRQTHDRVDGTMALIAGWLTIGTVSLHGFPIWHWSWWLYHIFLLLGVFTAVTVLVLEYEQLRRFRLTYYYAAVGLILTAGLALLASHLFSSLVEQYLVHQIAESEMITAVIRARLNGLLIASLSMGMLYLLMLVVVNRADRLITERNNQLTLAYTNLRAAEAMRDDMTDMIIHDLRTPLTAIKLGLELIGKNQAEPERDQQLLSRTQASVTQMMILINQLLDVARLETGQLKLNREPLQMAHLLQEKAATFASQLESGQKQLGVQTSNDLPVITADSELIGRVMDNLIGNALKYTERGGHMWLT
ncbi:MAG TPA: HAMP domain-containing sensor histidine kinase, partial [Chloroflexota bacterium]|nr:HAMP domain-containing sensor histidine kinase [Chloroflexota bacterium]